MKLLVVAAALALCASEALAQGFPSKPLRVISTTSPGGVNDILSRAFAQEISRSVGQPVLVENRPGAGSIIGMMALAKSPADGYTVAVTTPEPLVYNPLLYARLPYDPDKDFAAVSQITLSENVIVANPSVGGTLPEVIAYAKTNPGKLNYATWGAVSTPALYLAWINRQNGVDITPVPYKGAGPAIPATISGEVQLTFIALGFVLPQLKAGKLRALAFTGSKRSAILPDVPTLAEYNSDPDLIGFFGVFAPAGTPAPVLDRMSAEFARALRVPRLAEVLLQQTQVPVGSTPAEFAETLRYAKAQAAQVFKALGIRPSDSPPS